MLESEGVRQLPPLFGIFSHLENLQTTKIMADFINLNGEVIALIEDLDLQLMHIYDDNNVEIPYIELG